MSLPCQTTAAPVWERQPVMVKRLSMLVPTRQCSLLWPDMLCSVSQAALGASQPPRRSPDPPRTEKQSKLTDGRKVLAGRKASSVVT
eukprot:1672036-Rhodomonas_salina.4